MNTKDRYWSLNFDNKGGVNVNVYKENIDSSRWSEESKFIYDSTNIQYINLDKICKYLGQKNIKYVFVQSPARKNYIKNNQKQYNLHITKVRDIIQSNNQFFIEPQNIYNDSCFNDCIHMNILGSKKLTEEIIKKLKNEKIL